MIKGAKWRKRVPFSFRSNEKLPNFENIGKVYFKGACKYHRIREDSIKNENH